MPLDRLFMYIVKVLCQVYFAFVPNLSKSGNILF